VEWSAADEAGNGGGAGGLSGGTGGGQIVSTSGGTVMQDGVTISVPAGAVPSDTAITISTVSSPPGYAPASRAYQFGPSGTAFAKPIAVTIPMTSATPDAHLFWSNASGGFDLSRRSLVSTL